jgi:hypothetical protein
MSAKGKVRYFVMRKVVLKQKRHRVGSRAAAKHCVAVKQSTIKEHDAGSSPFSFREHSQFYVTNCKYCRHDIDERKRPHFFNPTHGQVA